MKEIFYFLCGNFEKRRFIYAIRKDKQPWHYFKYEDSIYSAHDSLPEVLESVIDTLENGTMRPIRVPLLEQQCRNYYVNGKFVFKNEELTTRMSLPSHITEDKTEKKLLDEEKETKTTKSKHLIKYTDQLKYNPDIKNPLCFLDEFEKCQDVKTDKDKLFKIRNFVKDYHRAEFSELYFTSDWSSVRQIFLKKYAGIYTENKKKKINIKFDEETSLRSFFELKLEALSSYTTLSFFNQIEIILLDLPNEISKLFLVKEMMTKSKAEIFDFCVTIQDVAQAVWENGKKEELSSVAQNDVPDDMEIFTYDPELEPKLASVGPSTSGQDKRKRGRPRLIRDELPDSVTETEESDSTCSQSSMSSDMSVELTPQATHLKSGRGKTGKGQGKVVKNGRGRPRKKLITIPEESSDMVAEYLNINSLSDTSSNKSNKLRRL